jgi:ABC-type cobalamin/Fe3+-siderophores transport system ATPase subunit
MPALLEFRDVSFSRGSRLLLDRLSFSIDKRDMVALLGPNGIGKTTLLRLATRLLSPDRGEILLEGKALSQWSRRGLPQTVALVSQDLEVPFRFPVEEIVQQGRAPHVPILGRSRAVDREVVEAAMEAVGVTHLRRRSFAELSGGERQRVKIAIGLAQQPKLMLLDEPTQHLDIGRQIELLSLLRDLNRRGLTIIAAVHDLNLVAENFTSAILLTPEPSWIAGSTADVLRPQLLERAFSVPHTELAQFCPPSTHSELIEVL